jgi:hypothetical protein
MEAGVNDVGQPKDTQRHNLKKNNKNKRLRMIDVTKNWTNLIGSIREI